MDRWLHTQARPAQSRGACTVWACVDANQQLLGFFTLSSHMVQGADVASRDRGGMSGAIPATLLGQLGLSSTLRGQGIGALLVLEALHEAYLSSLHVASRSVVLDAANDDLVDYYRTLNFKSTRTNESRMYMKMSTAAQALRVEGYVD